MKGGYEPVPPAKVDCLSAYPFTIHLAIGGCIISLTGAMMHFVYQWTGCSTAAAVFCAVNESVFEHIKIMLVPMLAWWLGFAWWLGVVRAMTSAMYTALVVLVVFNLVSIAAGVESLAYDIGLFVLSIFCGQAVGAELFRRKMAPSPWFTLALIFLLVPLFTCSFFTPHWAYMFEDHRNATYGRPAVCESLPVGRFRP